MSRGTIDNLPDQMPQRPPSSGTHGSVSDYVWVRVKAACRDCAVVIDMPAFVPKGSKPTAMLVHAAAEHYVDLVS